MCETMIGEHLPDKGQRIKTRDIQSTATSTLEEHAGLSSFLYFPRLLSLCLTEEGDRNGTGLSSEQRQEMVNGETHPQQHIAAGNL